MNADEERRAKRPKVDATDAGRPLTITCLVDASTHVTDTNTVRLSEVITNIIGDVDDGFHGDGVRCSWDNAAVTRFLYSQFRRLGARIATINKVRARSARTCF